jgi:two-component system, sensor histidine kinase and response regulator
MIGQAARRVADRFTVRSANQHVFPRGIRIGLTGRLFLLVILAVVPALVIQAWNEYDQRIAREGEIRQHVVEITKQFGGEIGVLREGARQLLLALAQLDPVKSLQPGACSALFAKLKSRYANYSFLGAADITGRVFCVSGPTSFSRVTDQPFFTRALAQPELAVGNYWIDPISNQGTIHFAERFEDGNGHIGGVVFAGLDLAWLSDHLKKRGLSPTASILIADREGNIIARLPHPELLVGKNMRTSHEPIMDGDGAGWEEAVGVDGTTRIFGYVPAALPPKDFFLSAGQSKAEAFAEIDTATRRGVGLILAGFLAAIYAAWAGGRKFIRRPIEGLLKVTTEWRKGNYEARAHLEDRASEIGRLGVAFDDMADALAARHAAQNRAEEELRDLNTTLEARIQQRTVELERAVEAKSQFLANMSHEIRTPLNGVVGMLELVRQTELGTTQQRFVETARRSADTLLGLINGVLDVSKIEAGRVELEHSAFDLRTLVEEVTESFSNLACGKGLELGCFVPADLPTAIVGDSGRLRQILTNLIGNAIKFTERGEVGIRVQLVEKFLASAMIAFEVSDTGIGIPAEKRDQIFEAFAQADSSTTRRYGGTGLGLTIAKYFCEIMGGTIHVASAPGVGSCFRVTARFGLQSGAAVSEAVVPAGDGMPVLVVTDNALSRDLLTDQLSARSVRSDHAQTGSDALAALPQAIARGRPYGCVIIDNLLPDMSGIELALTIKSAYPQGDFQLIVLTPFGREIDGLADSRFYWLTKPIRQSVLWDGLAYDVADVAPETSGADEAAIPRSSGTKETRVLLVEDNPVNLEVCVAILERLGYAVETATNGWDALERHANWEFGLIFMDCQMPEMDGYEATAEIRRRESQSHRHTPIIALTGNVIAGARERCLAAGMDDYLAKPFTLDQMRAMLTVWSSPPTLRATRNHLALVPASVSTEPVDYKVLDSLRQLQKEQRSDIVQQVINLFFKGAASLLKDLERGATNHDASLLHQASHALKSVSANVGATALSSRCKELEAMAQSGIVSDAAPMVRAILEDYRMAEILLSDRLQKVA